MKKQIKQIMMRAWEIARNGQNQFGGSVRSYISEAMKLAWKQAKNGDLEMKTELIEKAEKAGAKIWEKNGKKRLYFNTREVIARTFNYAIVERIEGCVPEGFDGMLTAGKTKSYIDLNNNIFFADNGSIANLARLNKFETRRI